MSIQPIDPLEDPAVQVRLATQDAERVLAYLRDERRDIKNATAELRDQELRLRRIKEQLDATEVDIRAKFDSARDFVGQGYAIVLDDLRQKVKEHCDDVFGDLDLFNTLKAEADRAATYVEGFAILDQSAREMVTTIQAEVVKHLTGDGLKQHIEETLKTYLEAMFHLGMTCTHPGCDVSIVDSDTQEPADGHDAQDIAVRPKVTARTPRGRKKGKTR